MSQIADRRRSRFARVFRATEHRRGLCVLAILTWIAEADGRVAPREMELLRKVAGANNELADLPAVVAAIGPSSVNDLELACRFLRNHADRGSRSLLAQLAITMAIQDGYLTVGENYQLQFIADLLGIRPRTFARLFAQIAHRPFPEAGDPSSIDWWRRREAGIGAEPSRFTHSATEAQRDTPAEETGPMTRAMALHLLGLSQGATLDEIHAKYRQLAKVRHPDRFARLGPAAVAAAGAAFSRLHEAYVLASGA